MVRIHEESLETFVHRLFEANGAPSDIASEVAASLVESDLRGHGSHGVLRAPLYIERINEANWIDQTKRASVEKETPTTAVLDGRSAFGQVVGRQAVDHAVEIAEENGVAAVGVRDATHLGRIGEWAERATESGMLFAMFVATQGGSRTVAPAGSADRVLATNPIAFGVPTFEALEFPIVLDMATSQVAHGKIREREKVGEPIPESWTTRSTGEPVTDPVAFEQDDDGALLPLGGRDSGYKGTGLAIVAELFGAILGNGFVAGQQLSQWVQNVAACFAVDPTWFTTVEEIEARIDALDDLLRSADYPPDLSAGIAAKDGDGSGLLPGEAEYRYLAEHRESGIDLPDETAELLADLAVDLGVGASIPEAFSDS